MLSLHCESGAGAPHSKAQSACEPSRQVTHVGLHIIEPLRLAFDLLARRFRKKTRTTHRCIPVVIDEVMKTRFSYRTSQRVSMTVCRRLESYHQVERAVCRLTHTRCHHASRGFIFRHTYCAFVRMGRKIFDHARLVFRIAHDLVNRVDNGQRLIITIGARMVVGPRDVLVALIVARLSQLVGSGCLVWKKCALPTPPSVHREIPRS